MRLGPIARGVGWATIAALVLSGCASTENTGDPDSSGDSSTAATGGSITVAEANAFSSFNAASAAGRVDINAKVDYLTHSNFNYIDEELNIVRNEEFGAYEVLSEDPLSVKYTVNEGVAWSDGEAIDAGDLLLSWAVLSGHFNDATMNPQSGEVELGTNYFSAGGPSGLGLTDVPEIGDDGRSITLEYSKPYADWEIAYSVGLPAHVVAQKSGLADEEALIELITTAPAGDPEDPQERPKLQKVADFWNSGFNTKSLPSDPSLYLSSGPYIVQSMVPDRSMTLVRNEDFEWGPKPKLDEITIRYIGAASAQVQALDNGDVDVIAPQASSETLSSLEAMDQIQLLVGNMLAYDHIDLNYSGVFDDVEVRKAFMHTVPRRDIAESILGQVNADVEPRDSFVFVPGTEGYEAAVPVNGSQAYEEVDIELAREMLAGATPEVRIGYNADDPNDRDAYTLVAESAEQAGFKVIDAGMSDSEWNNTMGSGSYDAAIFGWSDPGVAVTSIPILYSCGAPANFNGFCSDEADALMDQLILETDPAVQRELQIKIDTILFETGYGLPLYQLAGVNAAAEWVGGLVYNPGPIGIWHNFWEWSVPE